MKLGARSAGATNRWQHRAARERETRRQLKNGGLREGGGTQSCKLFTFTYRLSNRLRGLVPSR